MQIPPNALRTTCEFDIRPATNSIAIGSRRLLRPAACLAATVTTCLCTAPVTAGPGDNAGSTRSVSPADVSPATPLRERLRTDRIKLDADTSITYVRARAAGAAGSVANMGVPAAIYRSTACGFVNWIGGVPGWLNQMVLFNDGDAGAPLRTLSTRACFDACYLGNRCVGQGGAEDCDCLAPEDIPFDVTLQMYDGDPCGEGLPIAGASATFTMDETLIDLDTGLTGSFQCFTLEAAVDPKVFIPHDSWIEMTFGVDDAWPIIGNAYFNTGLSPLSGLDDGVDCVTFCDVGVGCTNSGDGCDWIISSADSTAEVLMEVVPTGNDKDGNLDPGVVIEGNTVWLPFGGRYVFFEIRIKDWDPHNEGRALTAYAYFVDAGGYSNDLEGKLTRAAPPCTTTDECVALFGPASRCTFFGTCESETCCTAHDIDLSHPDFIFSESTALCATDLSLPDQRGACTTIDPPVVPPDPFPAGGVYGGTFIVDVSPGAQGTFTAPLAIESSQLTDQNTDLIPFLGLIDAFVILPAPCCLPNGTCDDTLFEVDCEALGGTVVTSCEDTNNNGLGDLCETGGCCVGTTCTDSNFTDCSADGGTLVPGCLLDGDTNGTDDACECAIASAPAAETIPGPGGSETPRRKNRFLSVHPGNAGRSQAISVKFLQLPPPYDAWNGMNFFAGQPHQVCENPSQGLETPIADCGGAAGAPQRWFWAAPLVCDESLAAYRDWSTLADYCVRGNNDGRPCASDDDCPGGSCGSDDLIHLYHPGVVPSKLETTKGPIEIASVYQVRMIDRMCDSSVAANYSDPLTMDQAGWTDATADCTVCPCAEPNDRIDLITDCVGLLAKFSSLPCAMLSTRADLEPRKVDFKINMTDIIYCVAAFADTTYPFAPGDPCE